MLEIVPKHAYFQEIIIKYFIKCAIKNKANLAHTSNFGKMPILIGHIALKIVSDGNKFSELLEVSPKTLTKVFLNYDFVCTKNAIHL